MNREKKLSKRQLAVIEDLFSGELDEQAVLDRHNVSRGLYNKWLADGRFAGQFNERIGRFFRQSAALIARYAPLAAAKLIALTESDSQETARKACLDIISFLDSRCSIPDARGETRETSDELRFPLSPETASKILSALAEEQH